MKWRDFDEFYRIIREDIQSLFYCGEFSDEITIRLIDLSELSFSDSGGSINIRKKVSFLIAECFQNVVRHTSLNCRVEFHPGGRGFFMTRNLSGGGHYIASGNLIHVDDIESLRSRISNINNMGKNELKETYLKVLETGGISARGGAGLGLIDMARKSGRKLDASFHQINEQCADFYLQIYLGMEDGQDTKGMDHLGNSHAVKINELLRSNNVILAYQGDFCQESILPILTMIDKNLATRASERTTVKNLHHTLVELLQNIMHHGFVKDGKTEGVFVIGTDKDSHYIDAANYISNARVPALRDSLEQLAAMDIEGLREFYKKILKEGPKSPGGGAGLGLIDIMRLSRERPVFRFEQEDEEKTLFYFNIII
jgi:hypothetical protein